MCLGFRCCLLHLSLVFRCNTTTQAAASAELQQIEKKFESQTEANNKILDAKKMVDLADYFFWTSFYIWAKKCTDIFITALQEFEERVKAIEKKETEAFANLTVLSLPIFVFPL
jgi:hypothetical protein